MVTPEIVNKKGIFAGPPQTCSSPPSTVALEPPNEGAGLGQSVYIAQRQRTKIGTFSNFLKQSEVQYCVKSPGLYIYCFNLLFVYCANQTIAACRLDLVHEPPFHTSHHLRTGSAYQS